MNVSSTVSSVAMLAGLGDALEALAVAGKDFDAQLLFELDDGLGHAGLRGVQHARGLGADARGRADDDCGTPGEVERSERHALGT